MQENVIATGSFDNTVKIWNLNTESLLFTLTEHTNYVYTFSYVFLYALLFFLNFLLV